ncbi:MAG TPA: dihydrolipoyl dehydrogenase [Anaerolineaceae bacterium]|nr:dihydrolipoyl dehydrogenase [Anaerolineaceae bacterium]
MTHYAAIVIGAGPAGHTCAVRLAQLGAKVAVVERDYIGGICTNWGCTPSKSMIEAAKVARTVREAAKYGVMVDYVQVDFKAVAARRDEVILKSRQEVTELLEAHGVDVYLGEASVIRPGEVKIRSGKLDLDGYQMHYTGEETRIEADHIVLATGSQPLIPYFIDPHNPFVVSSNRLIGIGELPKRLTIVGGGVIGMEFATIFSNLGSEVTVIEYLDRILSMMDPEVSATLTGLYRENGVRIMTGHQVTGVEQGIVRAKERESGRTVEVAAEAVLIAIGRKPVIQEEMFDCLGIDYTDTGIRVDDQLRTSVPGVWAIGDATGKSILAHVGMQQGIICAENIMRTAKEPERVMRYDVIPAVVYSIPEIVSVGHAPSSQGEAEVYKVPFSANLRARIEGFGEGFLKIWVKDNRVIAAQTIGHGVSEMMQELANMITLKTPIDQVADLIHAHPTYSEIVRTALEYSRGKATDFLPEKELLEMA